VNEPIENPVAEDCDEPVENPMAARLYHSASGAARRAALVVGVFAVIAGAVALPLTPGRVAWLDVPLGAFVAWTMLALLFRVVSRASDLESRADAWARVIQPLALLLLVFVISAAFLVSARPDLADVAITLVASSGVSAVLVVLFYPILPRLPELGTRVVDEDDGNDWLERSFSDPAYNLDIGNMWHRDDD
jgi:cytochrome bd-type quinol oxidase subunit 2